MNKKWVGLYATNYTQGGNWAFAMAVQADSFRNAWDLLERADRQPESALLAIVEPTVENIWVDRDQNDWLPEFGLQVS